jgi:F-box/WD-40 domain protein MET30
VPALRRNPISAQGSSYRAEPPNSSGVLHTKMASNITHTITTVAIERSSAQPATDPSKRRRKSWRIQYPENTAMGTSTDPHTALMQGHDHEHASERSRHLQGETVEETEEAQASKSKKIEKMITPYLAQHIPQQYNPLGGADTSNDKGKGNTKFCYRHRPDLLCRRQADEPSMEQLQQVRMVVTN